MNSATKNRPCVAAQRRSVETGTHSKKATNSVNYHNTTSGCAQGRVYDLIPQGEANAISTAALVRLTGMKSARELQARIANERGQGFLILSTCRNGGGYFKPSDGETGQREIAAFVNTLRARAANTFRALYAARAALAVMDGQTEFDEMEEWYGRKTHVRKSGH